MKEISSPSLLAKEFKRLRENRRKKRVISIKRKGLTSLQRKLILEKTDHRCHVCGIELPDRFQADHVKHVTSGGGHGITNYLPSCRVCNRSRWLYHPEEIQWILTLGVWVRGEIEDETNTGKMSALKVFKHLKALKKRRK